MKKLALVVAILLLSRCKHTIEIKLQSNPSTGYTWSYTMTNNIVDIKEKYVSNCTNDKVGCGGKTVYTITPKEPGTTIIDFEYCFVGRDDCLTAKYDITVSKSLRISETHEGTYFKK